MFLLLFTGAISLFCFQLQKLQLLELSFDSLKSLV